MMKMKSATMPILLVCIVVCLTQGLAREVPDDDTPAQNWGSWHWPWPPLPWWPQPPRETPPVPYLPPPSPPSPPFHDKPSPSPPSSLPSVPPSRPSVPPPSPPSKKDPHPPLSPPVEPKPTPPLQHINDPTNCATVLTSIENCVPELIKIFFKDAGSIGQACCKTVTQISEKCFNKGFAQFDDPDFHSRVIDYCTSHY